MGGKQGAASDDADDDGNSYVTQQSDIVGQNIEESVAPGIGKVVELGEVNDDMNAAGNFNMHKDDKKVE